MDEAEWTLYPWPLLGVGKEGEVLRGTRALGELLAVRVLTHETLRECFELFDEQGEPISEGHLPWRRTGRGEGIRERQRWFDRRRNQPLDLWVTNHLRPGGGGILMLEDESRHALLELLPREMTRFAETVSRRAEPEAVAEAMIRFCLRLVRCDAAMVFVPGGRDELCLLRQAGLPSSNLAADARVDLHGPSLVARAAQSGELQEQSPLLPENEPLLAPVRTLDALGFRSFVAVPIKTPTELAGVLALARRQPGRLSWMERGPLESLRPMAALSLHAAQTERIRHRREVHRQGLIDASLGLRAGLPLTDIMRRVVALACELGSARYGVLGLTGADHRRLSALVEVDSTELPPGGETEESVTAVVQAVIKEGRAQRGELPWSVAHSRTEENLEYLAVPISVDGRTFASLLLCGPQEGHFQADAERLLEQFSGPASLALGYARQLQQIEDQRRLLEAILQSAPDGMVYLEPNEGRVIFANAAAERILGRPLIDESFFERSHGLAILHPDGSPYAVADMPTYRSAHGETVEGEEVHVRGLEGTVTPLMVNSAPVRSARGEILGVVLVFQDISQFRELERLREELAAVIAHDLRTPVQALLLETGRLLRAEHPDGKYVPSFERMHRTCLRLARLVSDLLDAARVDVGRLNLETRSLLLEGLAREVVDRMRTVLGSRPVELELAGGLRPVHGDALRLEQVLTNLLDNAHKFSPPGAPITVRLCADGEGNLLEVEDRGGGIPPEDLPRVFERFFQIRRKRQERTGLGLGLYIARKLVEAHGGRIWVTSTRGHGSTFHVWLPWSRPALSSGRPEAEAARAFPAGAEAPSDGGPPQVH